MLTGILMESPSGIQIPWGGTWDTLVSAVPSPD